VKTERYNELSDVAALLGLRPSAFALWQRDRLREIIPNFKVGRTIRHRLNCRTLPVAGLPTIAADHRLPENLTDMYAECGGADLSAGKDLPVQICSSDEFVPSNPEIVGEQACWKAATTQELRRTITVWTSITTADISGHLTRVRKLPEMLSDEQESRSDGCSGFNSAQSG